MSPVTVALANDYDVVVHGLEAMLEPFADRVRVVELNADTTTITPVDVTFYDTFAQQQGDSEEIAQLVTNPNNGRVVVYTWNTQPTLVAQALARGCSGYLDKSTAAQDLVTAVERIAAGEVVTPDPRPQATAKTVRGAWPGQEHGLSARESEILALITQGMTNDVIAARAYLSINTVKSYIRTTYRKIGVTRRSQAVRWGMEHGMLPDHTRELR